METPLSATYTTASPTNKQS